jgi:hypothetical protein
MTSMLSDSGGSCSWILLPLLLCSVPRLGATCVIIAALVMSFSPLIRAGTGLKGLLVRQVRFA